MSIATAAEAMLARTPPQWAFARRARTRLAVLAYHGVDDVLGFRAQLEIVATSMHAVSVEEVVAAVQQDHRLPPRAVLVTFDDGEPSVVAALPLLREHRIPVCVFVNTALIGTSRPQWWVEADWLIAHGATAPTLCGVRGDYLRPMKRLRHEDLLATMEALRASASAPAPPAPQLAAADLAALAREGVEVGNHTHRHALLDRCDEPTVRSEIRVAHDLLTAVLGSPPRVFAYPNGYPDARAERVLSELGYAAAFLFDHRLAVLAPDRRYAISRLRVNTGLSADRFRIILSGLHSFLCRSDRPR
jgi:peptidoglycan/xylan/chitin deacetylase (PgdA/CDA1 family)